MSCISCASKIFDFLDLGSMAFANAFLTDVDVFEKKEPLKVAFCPKCYLVQLSVESRVNPSLLFNNYDYFTSSSPQLYNHFYGYAEEIVDRCDGIKDKLIVEIASNDGLLLSCLRSKGAKKLLGVDPATNVVKECVANGFIVKNDFFDSRVASEIKNEYGDASLIIANNVLAHTPNPKEILNGVYSLLESDGVFVCEVQHLKKLVEDNEWTNVYHEHFSYFSLMAIVNLFFRYGLHVFRVTQVPTQGGSLRIWASKKCSFGITQDVSDLINSEIALGLDSFNTYVDFSNLVKDNKSEINKLFNDLTNKVDKPKIVGYGAPAKGNTLLQYCGLDNTVLDYIIDEAKSKQFKFTPGTHIPVYQRSKLLSDVPNYILLLAWNYSQSIIKKEDWFTQTGGKFIITVPTVKVL